MNKAFENFMDNYTNLNHTDKDKFDTYRIIVDGFKNDVLMFGGEILEYVREICFLDSSINEECFINIKKASSLYFVKCELPTRFSLHNTYFVEISNAFNSLHRDSLLIDTCDHLIEVCNMFGENLLVDIEKCNSFKSFNILNVCILHIKNCSAFDKMSNIKSHHIKRCYLDNIKNIDKCETLFDYLIITNCENIRSFSNIQKLKVADCLVLENLCTSNSNNLINILFCNSKNVCLIPKYDYKCQLPHAADLSDIMIKYLKMNNSAEHAMDCAMELLDNNFYAAAEL